MNVTCEKLSSNKVKLTFTVDAAKFEEGMQAAYKKTVKRFNIPGFRKGHAPRKVIEVSYGESVFYEDALDAIFPEMYQQAIKDNELHPVDRPELDVQEIGTGKDTVFSVEVFVRPDVELGNYKEIEAVKTVAEVTDDDVKAEIERARERVARYVDVTDRPAQLDDQVNIDYKGLLNDVPFEGGTAEKYDLTLGSGAFIPGFEDQVVGMTIGEEKDLNVTFPEEYHSEELKGKAVVFKVKLNGIQKKELPEMDDEFAKDVSECDTFEAYKAETKQKLIDNAEKRAENEFESEVIEKVVESANVDIPDAMIEDAVDNMIRDMELRMMYQGMRMEDYLKYTGQTIEQVRAMYKEPASSRVKTQLVLEAVMKAEAIEANEAEVDEEIKQYAENSKQSFEEFKATLKDGDLSYFKEMASMQKTVDFLKSCAK